MQCEGKVIYRQISRVHLDDETNLMFDRIQTATGGRGMQATFDDCLYSAFHLVVHNVRPLPLDLPPTGHLLKMPIFLAFKSPQQAIMLDELLRRLRIRNPGQNIRMPEVVPFVIRTCFEAQVDMMPQYHNEPVFA